MWLYKEGITIPAHIVVLIRLSLDKIIGAERGVFRSGFTLPYQGGYILLDMEGH